MNGKSHRRDFDRFPIELVMELVTEDIERKSGIVFSSNHLVSIHEVTAWRNCSNCAYLAPDRA